MKTEGLQASMICTYNYKFTRARVRFYINTFNHTYTVRGSPNSIYHIANWRILLRLMLNEGVRCTPSSDKNGYSYKDLNSQGRKRVAIG